MQSAEIAANQYVAIERDGRTVGRIVYNGWDIWVERLHADGGYHLIGFYERSRPQHFDRKAREIDDVFDEWAKLRVQSPENTRVCWRPAQSARKFLPPPRAASAGCAVVLHDGIPIAHIYKTTSGAQWVEL